MRAKEFIAEGIIGDLRAAGQQNQAELGAKIKQGIATGAKNLAMKLPGAKTVAKLHSKLADFAMAARDQATLSRAADQWIEAWTDELLNQNEIRRVSGQQPMKQADYNKALESWLEQSLKVNADPTKMARYVTDMNPKSLKDYFQKYFIPTYIKSQQTAAQPAQPTGAPVPTGQRIVVIHPMTQGKYYKTAQGWTNEAGQRVAKKSSIDYLEDLVAKDPVKYEPAR
jgi:hypothetical protein